MKRNIIVLVILVSLVNSGRSFAEDVGNERKVKRIRERILSLENDPEIGGEAVLKLSIGALEYKDYAEITCCIPKGLEFINNNNYKLRNNIYCSGEEIVFWRGYMAPGEVKEFVFKVKVPDGKKYELYSSYGKGGGYFELDLGQPELPEWNIHNDQYRWLTMPGEEPKRIGTNVYELTSNPHERKEIIVEGEQYPPILSELKIRTKHIPYNIDLSHGEVPLRYFVYTDIDAKEVLVKVGLPSNFELIDKENYELIKENGATYIKLYQGAMKAKESKAFYFKIRTDKPEEQYAFSVRGKIEALTIDGRRLLTEDYSLTIDF